MVVVARGVKQGLEKAVRFLMPLLLVLLLVLVGYAMNTGHFSEAIDFLFKPDFSKLTGGAILTAMGHAFFTLSLGMGAIMIYGSYLPANTSIAKTSIIISLADTLVALLAGLAIFPIVFSFPDLVPGAGPGLIFQTLPLAFANMPGGLIFGTLFFILIVVAAWTSSISLIEPAVAWLIENRGMSRVQAAVWSGLATWLVGIATVLSFNLWAFDFNFLGTVKHNGIFDILDILTANIMLPLGRVAYCYIRRLDDEREAQQGRTRIKTQLCDLEISDQVCRPHPGNSRHTKSVWYHMMIFLIFWRPH